MKVVERAMAGTMESSDIMITIQDNPEKGIRIQLTSSVEKQFGEHIRETIKDYLEALKVEDAEVIAVDKGALDCVIKARVYTAAHRACQKDTYCWEGR